MLSLPSVVPATRMPCGFATATMARSRRFSTSLGMTGSCPSPHIGTPRDGLRVIVSRSRPPIASMSPTPTPTMRCITANGPNETPDHALQRTRPSRPGCNPCVPRIGVDLLARGHDVRPRRGWYCPTGWEFAGNKKARVDATRALCFEMVVQTSWVLPGTASW